MDAMLNLELLSPLSDQMWSTGDAGSIYSSVEECSDEIYLSENAKLLNKNAIGCKIQGHLLVIDLNKQSKGKKNEIFRVLNTKGSAKGDKRSRKEEIEQFLSEKQPVANRQVSKMRHVIPLFLMETYSCLYGQHSFKVKGMWDNKPADWPCAVPFLDPNNNFNDPITGKSAKPTKDVLVAMLQHLVVKYQEKMTLETQQSVDCPSFPKQVVDNDENSFPTSGSGVIWESECLDSTHDAVNHIMNRIAGKLVSMQENSAYTEYLQVFRTRYSELRNCPSDSIIIQAHGLEMFIDLLCNNGQLCNGWEQKLMTFSEPMENLVASGAVKSTPSMAGSGCHTSLTCGSGDFIDGCMNRTVAGNNSARLNCDPIVHDVGLIPNLNIETRGFISEDRDILSHLNLRPELLNKYEDVQPPCSAGGENKEDDLNSHAIELRENGQITLEQDLDLAELVTILEKYSGEREASNHADHVETPDKLADSYKATEAVSNAIAVAYSQPDVAVTNHSMRAPHSHETNVSIPAHVELINDEHDSLLHVDPMSLPMSYSYEQRPTTYSGQLVNSTAILTTLQFMDTESNSILSICPSQLTFSNSCQPPVAPVLIPNELMSVKSPTGQTIASMEGLSLNGRPLYRKLSDGKPQEVLELSTEGYLTVDSVASTSSANKRTAPAPIPTMVWDMDVDDDEEAC